MVACVVIAATSRLWRTCCGYDPGDPIAYAELGGVGEPRACLGGSGGLMSMSVSELKGRVGQELFVSDWIVVPLELELAFEVATLLTEEHLGFDPAGTDPYGPELVSGFLLLSLLVYFHKKHRVGQAEGLYGLNYGTDRVRFLAPVMAGQRVRCRARLRSLDARGDGSWRVVTDNTLELEGSPRPAMVADWITYHAPVPTPGDGG